MRKSETTALQRRRQRLVKEGAGDFAAFVSLQVVLETPCDRFTTLLLWISLTRRRPRAIHYDSLGGMTDASPALCCPASRRPLLRCGIPCRVSRNRSADRRGHPAAACHPPARPPARPPIAPAGEHDARASANLPRCPGFGPR